MHLIEPITTAAGQERGQFFAGLNPLDWAIIIVLAFSALTAFMRGLVRSLISIAGVVLGILLAAWYAPALAQTLVRWIPQPAFAEIAAFLLILVACYATAVVTGRLLRGAVEAVGLGFADRLGGAGFGVLRAVLLLAAALVPLTPFLPMLSFSRDSVLLPYLRTAAHGVSFVLPQDFGDRLAPGALSHLPATAAPADARRRTPNSKERGTTAQGEAP